MHPIVLHNEDKQISALGHVVRTDVDSLGGGLFHKLNAGGLGVGFGDYFDNQLLSDAGNIQNN